MPDLDFQILGVKPASHGITPLLEFDLRVANLPSEEPIQTVALHVQIQIECPKRSYSPTEKVRLAELFGTPDRWGKTLRARLWTHVDVMIPSFTSSTTHPLLVPCTFDLGVASAKYFYALDGGEVSLLFLFSGSVFYQAHDGRLQMSRISWNKEAPFRIPVERWKEAIEAHYPRRVWLSLDRDVFERLYAFKRAYSLSSWEEAFDRLLGAEVEEPLLP